ncbi:predicted protein [Nematostella vectensis]|uniref:Sister chromatid cohesion protein DCC1 n=2 Tax=Nematostella vectensis TaxID=45351 RepID=A7SXS6_NEMVE|nr:predicted protein [Nematostella vectensis]|eukprot:XP_001623591.1 predicted protein [Nematostella vectensis]
MSDEYRLLELSPKLLETLEQGESLVIRGENQEEALLFSKDTTFEVKLADTSNTLLLTPSCQTPKDNENSSPFLISYQVSSCHSEYLEVRSGRPRLQKLRRLLEQAMYKGPEYENKGDDMTDGIREKFTLDDLLNVVQGSEQEIKQKLDKLGALEINGHWRLLEKDYEERATMRILTYLEEMAWDYQRVPLDECCDGLKELQPSFVTEYCLRHYGKLCDGCMEEVHYHLLEDKICRFYAEYLLRPAGRFNYHEFMESWQQSVPDGMTTTLEHLQGIALTDMKSHPPVIWHFPASDLPEEPEIRFNKLFKTRNKWTFDEIQPYIRDLVGTGQPLNSLLLKYARSSKDDAGNKVYNSKKPV